MNQAIQFVDRVEYENGVITFYAMVNGLLLPCIIELKVKERSDALAHFAEHRFDYEELAEQQIEEEAFGEEGEVQIKALA
ncbi:MULTISPECIES: DUF1488 family protein [Pseudoalteromonas]|uniref:DUF1488 family protein n=1 Tax=Pseudoalteromonas qingdaonensis TaxID=3131913 RepID=A0ABU9MZG0_9GAMM|nr:MULTISPECIES: DUF1488 family protein [unclassified Pseudoalteromonas]MBS3796968.1 DUF1488 family protein [Pseudoalteromonas sp. BDTF-M6]